MIHRQLQPAECRDHHVQTCSCCPDYECGDNNNPVALRVAAGQRNRALWVIRSHPAPRYGIEPSDVLERVRRILEGEDE